jgi:RNA polymerase sigma factor (sigma-70 family)
MNTEQVIVKYNKLIQKIVNKFSKGLCCAYYDRDDLYQDVVTELHSKLSHYNDKYAMTTFITLVLNNYLVDKTRERKTQKNVNYLKNGDKMVRVKDTKNFNMNYLIDESNLTKKEKDALCSFHALLELKDERTKNIVTSNKINGNTLQTVSNEFGLSVSRVSQIVNEFLETVKEDLNLI